MQDKLELLHLIDHSLVVYHLVLQKSSYDELLGTDILSVILLIKIGP